MKKKENLLFQYYLFGTVTIFSSFFPHMHFLADLRKSFRIGLLFLCWFQMGLYTLRVLVYQ